MGTVFKKTVTKPLPAGAKIVVRKGQRLAEWKDARGRTRTAPLTVGRDGADRIVIAARTYTAKYRDGSGIVREVPTGCRDEQAARSVLTDLEKRAEKVKGKILTVAEADAIDHQATPLTEHFAAYLAHLEAEASSPVHRANVRRALQRLAADCRYNRLADLGRESLERWLVIQAKAGMGPRTRNTYRAAVVAFCNWCLESGRLIVNPFANVPKADENVAPRRKRRALTEEELVKLLDVARRRPLLEAMTIRTGKRKGEAVARVRPEVQRHLERLGWERALIYKTLVLTGLRKSELASLTVGQLDLDADPPFLVLDAADEKNREGSSIPLRTDLAAELREWLADRANTANGQPEGGAVLPLVRTSSRPTANAPVFRVPRDLVRILDRDLKLAGIPKRDERGRTVDVHAMRHTFGTLLSKRGVSPRTAQAAMRHSDVNLTMNTYTDPKLLDVAGAVEALPSLPLSGGSQGERIAAKATGTDDSRASEFAPKFAPTTGKPCKSGSIPVQVTGKDDAGHDAWQFAASACPVNDKSPLTTAVNGLCSERETGFEPATSSLGS